MRWNTAEQGSNLSMFLQRTHPALEEVGHTTGVYTPTLFEQWCDFFYITQESDK